MEEGNFTPHYNGRTRADRLSSLSGRLAVEPSQRGNGYGSILIRAAMERAKERGAESIYLLSNTKLQPAIALYQKHGFQTVTEGPHPLYARCNIVMEYPGRSSHASEQTDRG